MPTNPDDLTHDDSECTRINSSIDYHTKSYSYRFECPTCGKSRRYNTNFLGRRVVICSGDAIRAVRRQPQEV